MLKRIFAALGIALLTALAVAWSRQYAALDRSLAALNRAPESARAASPSSTPSAPATPVASAPAAITASAASAPAANSAPQASAPAPVAPTPEPTPVPKEPAPAPAPKNPSAANGPDPLSPAPPPPAAAPVPPRNNRGVSLAESGAGASEGGPLIKLRALNGGERLGVVLDKGIAIGPIMELAYEPGVMRLESLATEPVAIFQVKASKGVPVVNPLHEKAGTPVKICGIGDEGVSCVPARLRQSLRYFPPDDQVVLEAGSFNAVFPGGGALFKTGPGGGLLGYQSAAIEGGSAKFVPVNYFGRFVMLRNSLGPLLDVAFSDILMQGRRDANYNPLLSRAPAPAPASSPGSAPAAANSSATAPSTTPNSAP